ncbi:MAG: C69 family dipeptidase [Promethearchaeota archaeon]
MCDTIVALANATRDGVVLFGKNSDREFNESQQVVHFPRRKFEKGAKIKCTHVEVPASEETFEVVLSKPYWIWGAEMGANEFGVCIGNETVFTKEPFAERPGLIGMDLLRLALERAKDARSALDVITGLLGEYGQGGTCSATDPNYQYHNSFIIADTRDAWVLETAGKYWAAEKVEDVRSISNGLTIGAKVDLAHDDLVSHAIQQGWCGDDDQFNFTECYGDPSMPPVTGSGSRQACTMGNLTGKVGDLQVKDLMAFLRDHGPSGDKWTPARSDMTSVCMHASSRALSQTCGSQVSHLDPELQTHWFTGTPIPCISLFKPVFLPGIGLEAQKPVPGARYDPETLWWQGEKLHRLVDLNYPARSIVVKKERDLFERELLEKAARLVGKLKGLPASVRYPEARALTREAFKKGFEVVREWTGLVTGVPEDEKLGRRMRRFFKKYNETADLSLD